MPKLYEYFGISVYFYAGEHLPVHVHGRHGSSETVADRRPLSGTARRHFVELVEAKAKEILQKWTDVFVLNKPVKIELLTRRIK
jgi:hypothetical protein